MTNVLTGGERLFSAPGHPFADYGSGVSPDEALARVQEVAQQVRQGEPEGVAHQIAVAFRRTDVMVVPAYVYTTELRDDPVGWVAAAQQADLRAFARWMRARHEQLQAALNRHRGDCAQNGLVAFAGLAGSNIIGDETLGLVEAALKNTPIKAMSCFERGESHGALAVCRGEPGRAKLITMSNMFGRPSSYENVLPEMQVTYLHEAIHAAGFNALAGFVLGLTRFEQPTQLLEEVTVSHMVAAAVNGQFEILDPADRFEGVEMPYYMALRGLIAVLGKYGPRKLPPELLVEAYFSPMLDRGRPFYPRRALEDRLERNVHALLPGHEDGGWYGICKKYNDLSPLKQSPYIRNLTAQIIQRATGGVVLDAEPSSKAYGAPFGRV